MVANAIDTVGLKPATGAFSRTADRWIYVFMAGLFVVTVLAGFIPDSMGMVAAVQAGQRPPLPPVLHAHAVLMGTWLLLLLTQSTLVATGRRAFHQQLGLIGMVVAPAMVVAMIGLVRNSLTEVAAIPPGLMPPDALNATKLFVANLLLEQIRVVIFFASFVGWALAIRRKDPEAHKRLMLLATAMPLPAALNRIQWLYSSLPVSPTTSDLYTLLWLLPALLYDIARRGHVHRVYVIGILLNLPFMLATQLLWGSAWWAAAAPRLMGVTGW